MQGGNFVKNDAGFICLCCGNKVKPLGYTSRNHCNECLTSIHVDINPGDRANKCKGILKPVDVDLNNKKGYVINYTCQNCGQKHKNKAAIDDNYNAILSLSNKTYDKFLKELLNKGR